MICILDKSIKLDNTFIEKLCFTAFLKWVTVLLPLTRFRSAVRRFLNTPKHTQSIKQRYIDSCLPVFGTYLELTNPFTEVFYSASIKSQGCFSEVIIDCLNPCSNTQFCGE